MFLAPNVQLDTRLHVLTIRPRPFGQVARPDSGPLLAGPPRTIPTLPLWWAKQGSNL